MKNGETSHNSRYGGFRNFFNEIKALLSKYHWQTKKNDKIA